LVVQDLRINPHVVNFAASAGRADGATMTVAVTGRIDGIGRLRRFGARPIAGGGFGSVPLSIPLGWISASWPTFEPGDLVALRRYCSPQLRHSSNSAEPGSSDRQVKGGQGLQAATFPQRIRLVPSWESYIHTAASFAPLT